jgi:hypothetical protein
MNDFSNVIYRHTVSLSYHTNHSPSYVVLAPAEVIVRKQTWRSKANMAPKFTTRLLNGLVVELGYRCRKKSHIQPEECPA